MCGGFFVTGNLEKRVCRMDYKTVAEVAAVALAGSELLSLSPALKANGWLQLALQALRLLANGKKGNKAKRRG